MFEPINKILVTKKFGVEIYHDLTDFKEISENKLYCDVVLKNGETGRVHKTHFKSIDEAIKSNDDNAFLLGLL